ncbi:hypothetical protein RJ640_001502 [Escallonia rubra]|uniref:Protein kinase domain-containing protein n=1 Tax=Escallonia rubra TaxID=112253 RepID=A0AA88R4Q5_9ASTE|nr:hypothetical protein RJ640_001502 [Escallonia rubra]
MFRRVLNLSLIYSWLLFAMNCRGSVAAAGLKNKTDRQALLAFKDLIQEDPFAALSSWNDSLHFCEWKGVTCGRQHQRVTALRLVSQNLVGSVSPQIGRLTFLRKIHLDNNSFHGTIPPDIGHLFRLQTLSLIPQEIGNLNNLYVLAIDHNMIFGSIPESIGKLSKLQKLQIVINNISGKIPPSIGNITGLSLVDAADNMLEGSIPAELGNCTKLQALDLGSNRLTGVIPKQVIGISSLTLHLYLDLNEFTGSLPSQVGNLKNLGVLSISGNKLTGELPSALGDCQVLEYLDLHGNLLDGTIPSSLDQLKGIQQLDLSQNNLSGQIPEFLGKLPLMRLNLSHNMFEGEVPKVGMFNNISAFSVVGKNMKLCGGIQPLHLPACPIKFSKKNKRPFPDKMIPLLIILPIVLLLACLFLIFYRLKKSQQRTSSASLLENQYPKITYAELFHATNEFSPSNLIGEGRYGYVFKGSLNSGEHIVAVKVLKLQEHGANKSFLAECDVFRILRHRNLVKIITACSSLDFKGKDFKALVFEFMPNGSLDNWLHPTQAEEQGSNLNLV